MIPVDEQDDDNNELQYEPKLDDAETGENVRLF